MFIYQIAISLHTIDYYTDEYDCFDDGSYKFADKNIWLARQKLRLFLLAKQKDTSIVRFYEIELKLHYTLDNQIVDLGKWFLTNYPQREHLYLWNWETEHNFLVQHQLLRSGDSELLAIEKEFYEKHYFRKNDITSLAIRLDDFINQYQTNFSDFGVELGILYFIVGNYQQSFTYLITVIAPELQWITYKVAFYLAHLAPKPDYEYIRKYEKLYPIALPFLS